MSDDVGKSFIKKQSLGIKNISIMNFTIPLDKHPSTI